MKTIECPVCHRQIQYNYMVFSIHQSKHGITYSEAKEKWFELRKLQTEG